MVFVKQQPLCSKWLQNSLKSRYPLTVPKLISVILGKLPRQRNLTSHAFVRIQSNEPIVEVRDMLLQMKTISREMKEEMCFYLFAGSL